MWLKDVMSLCHVMLLLFGCVTSFIRYYYKLLLLLLFVIVCGFILLNIIGRAMASIGQVNWLKELASTISVTDRFE